MISHDQALDDTPISLAEIPSTLGQANALDQPIPCCVPRQDVMDKDSTSQAYKYSARKTRCLTRSETKESRSIVTTDATDRTWHIMSDRGCYSRSHLEAFNIPAQLLLNQRKSTA